MKKPDFISENIYHIYNRGVEKRNIFMEDLDYLRFIHDLFEFNDTDITIPMNQRLKLSHPSNVDTQRLTKLLEVEPPKVEKVEHRRKLLVEILAFILMPNHFHMLVRQKKEKGIVKFMQKLGTGYTMYFNQKYERVGPLFQGRFKAITVLKEEHLLYLPSYIHLNCLDLIEPEWRNGKIQNFKKAIKFLESYRWSSYMDCIGKKNFPSVTSREFLLKCLGGEEGYKESTIKWLKEMNEEKLEEIQGLILEK